MYRLIFLSALTLFSLSIETLRAQQMYEPVAEFEADRSALHRLYSIRQSEEFYTRLLQLYSDHLGKLEAMDFERFDLNDRIDYIAFRHVLERQQYELELARNEFLQVQHVTAYAGPLYDFIRVRRTGKQPDAPLTAELFHNMVSKTNRALADLNDENRFASWQQAEAASGVVKSLKDALEEAYNFYYGYDIAFTWWAQQPFQMLHEALDQYQAALVKHFTDQQAKDDGSGIIGRPIGRDAIIQSLLFEMIPYTPEELIALAEKELAWCEKEMIRAAEELGYGNNWHAALEHVKNSYLPPGEWPERIHAMALEAISFIEDHDLMTIPDMAKETWRMIMMSPERQKMSPFFLGGEAIIIAYPTHNMAHDDKMMSLRGNNPHFARAVVHHELIPGHHMQQFMNQRHHPYRRLFYTPFWIEGWALYWEFNLYDKGFAATPEDRIGMLFWRKHRAARIIFSLSYHMEKMTPQECIDYLVERVGHERANAEAEVRRSFTGRYGPLYQIAYMIGGLQFMELKNELVLSGAMTEKEFHDKIISNNSLPVELVRALLLEQELPRNYSTQWRFLEDRQ